MGAPATRGGPGAVFLVVAAAVLAVDQLAKAAARGNLGPEAPSSLLGNWVRLKLTHNTGSAFGVVSEGWVLVAVGLVVCVAIVAYVTVGRGLAGERGRAVPLGLVLGGSLGNLLDRIRSGGVTDFIDLRVWPVFNLADIAITVGIALLAIRLLRRR